MRAILLIAGAALALSACGDRNEADEANTLAEENLALNTDLNADLNATGNLDGNAATDANLTNALIEDATTNDADTNLANGM